MVVLYVYVRRSISASNDAFDSLEAFNLFSFPLSINFKGFDVFARKVLPVLDVALFLCVDRLDVVLDSLVAFEIPKSVEILPSICVEATAPDQLNGDTSRVDEAAHCANDYNPAISPGIKCL